MTNAKTSTPSLSVGSAEKQPHLKKQPPAKRTEPSAEDRANRSAALAKARADRKVIARRLKYATDPAYRASRKVLSKQYWQTHQEEHKVYKRNRYANDPKYRARKQQLTAAGAARYRATPAGAAKIKEYLRSRYENDKEAVRAEWAALKRQQWKKPEFRLLSRLRGKLANIIREGRGKKIGRTFELVGCSLEELKKHIEAQFVDGMSWERLSEIHIDHKIPCRAFDMFDLEQQKACFHFSNLQPLWAVDNLKKLREDLKVPKKKLVIAQAGAYNSGLCF